MSKAKKALDQVLNARDLVSAQRDVRNAQKLVKGGRKQTYIVEMTIKSRVKPVKVEATDEESAKDAAEDKHPNAERIWNAYTLSEWRQIMKEHRAAKAAVSAPIVKAAKEEDIAAWVVNSYPEMGDAAFMVRSPGPSSGFAREFWEGLRSYFAARPFIRTIQSILAEAKGEVSVSIETQNQAWEIWKKDAKKFLIDMYKAHGNGRKKFGDNWQAVENWLAKSGHLKATSAQVSAAKDTGNKAGDKSRRSSLTKLVEAANKLEEMMAGNDGFPEVHGAIRAVQSLVEASGKLDACTLRLASAPANSEEATMAQAALDDCRSSIDTMLKPLMATLETMEELLAASVRLEKEFAEADAQTKVLHTRLDGEKQRLSNAAKAVQNAAKIG